MPKKRGHDWQPKGARVQTCTKCGWEKWNPHKIYHSPDGLTKDTGRPRIGKEPPCIRKTNG